MPLAKRIAKLGWHIQCNMPPEQLVQMEALLISLPVPVIIDHLGRAIDTASPQYKTVRKLLDSGHGWVKVSGAYLYKGGTARLCRRQFRRPRLTSPPRRSAASGAVTGRIPTRPRS